MRPLFTLGARLALCADLVRPGSALCDVGTDHAYLPIWLLKTGKIPRALACDVNSGPLEAARRDGEKYQVGGELTLRLSDGLRQVTPEEAEDVVIAGMGGELILRIVEETPWLREGERRLVLQPMSSVPELRRGLRRLGFAVLEEHAVRDGGKVYSAFTAESARGAVKTDDLYPWMGKLVPGEPHVDEYARKVLRKLSAQRKGALHRGDTSGAGELEEWIREIGQRYLGENSSF